MIKFNDQSERKQSLLKLLSIDMKIKTKSKDPPTDNHKKITEK